MSSSLVDVGIKQGLWPENESILEALATLIHFHSLLFAVVVFLRRALTDQMVCVLQDEDEWKEFEQKEVDYSGLRVQAMQIRYGLVTNMFR